MNAIYDKKIKKGVDISDEMRVLFILYYIIDDIR